MLKYSPTIPRPNRFYIYNKTKTGKALPSKAKPKGPKNPCQVTPAIPIQIPIPSGFLQPGELLEQYAELTQYNNPLPPTSPHNKP